MIEPICFAPPRLRFDPRLANELARHEAQPLVRGGEGDPVIARRSPFNGYERMLTPEGGILIRYKDQERHLFLTIMRVFTWIMATGMGAWLIFVVSPLPMMHGFFAVLVLAGVNALIVCRRIIVSHSVEIRPDAMIIDGEDVFYAEDIGEYYPELQMKDGDPDQLVIAGICGTRFVEYMTANRLDNDNDRTAEVLAADLRAAMEQLWGRREVSFPAEY